MDYVSETCKQIRMADCLAMTVYCVGHEADLPTLCKQKPIRICRKGMFALLFMLVISLFYVILIVVVGVAFPKTAAPLEHV